MSTKNIGLLAAGIGVGAAVALLYAPKSGKVTRRYVRAKATSGARYVREHGEQLKNATADKIERGKQTLQGTKSHLSAAIDAGREAYRGARTL